jgi:beta-lactamase regulating signal transducer with metallopeptidase domain
MRADPIERAWKAFPVGNAIFMAIGTSLFLIAVGAVLRWAVSAHTSGVNIHTIGLILLIVGIVGFLFSLLYMFVIVDRWPRRRDPVARDPLTVDHDRY